MITSKLDAEKNGCFVQVEGSAIDVTEEVLHILRAVYEYGGDTTEKELFRSAIVAAVTGEGMESVWGTPMKGICIDLSQLHGREKLQKGGEQ